MFDVGYKKVLKNLKDKPYYNRNCNNCQYYSQEENDPEELCQNSEVTEFDMIYEPENNKMYCIRWQPFQLSK